MTNRQSMMLPAAAASVVLTMMSLIQVFDRQRWFFPSLFGVLVAFGVGWRVVNTPGLAESLLSDQEVVQLVEHDFANYYSENPAADFAFQVWLNNAQVTAICLVLGIAIVPVQSTSLIWA